VVACEAVFRLDTAAERRQPAGRGSWRFKGKRAQRAILAGRPTGESRVVDWIIGVIPDLRRQTSISTRSVSVAAALGGLDLAVVTAMVAAALPWLFMTAGEANAKCAAANHPAQAIDLRLAFPAGPNSQVSSSPHRVFRIIASGHWQDDPAGQSQPSVVIEAQERYRRRQLLIPIAKQGCQPLNLDSFQGTLLLCKLL
jgi:hypothetical protein